MTHQVGVLTEPRSLTQEELELTTWLLRHGIDGAEDFLPQLDKAKVFSHCQCGCASINFSNDGKRPQTFAMRILADYQWTDEFGRKFGVFVFEQDDLLAGLDVWSIDGAANVLQLPPPFILEPLCD